VLYFWGNKSVVYSLTVSWLTTMPEYLESKAFARLYPIDKAMHPDAGDAPDFRGFIPVNGLAKMIEMQIVLATCDGVYIEKGGETRHYEVKLGDNARTTVAELLGLQEKQDWQTILEAFQAQIQWPIQVSQIAELLSITETPDKSDAILKKLKANTRSDETLKKLRLPNDLDPNIAKIAMILECPPESSWSDVCHLFEHKHQQYNGPA